MLRLFKWLGGLFREVRENRLNRGIMRYFDWWMLLIIVLITIMGLLSIISANTDSLTSDIVSVRELLVTQDTRYAMLQLLWFGAGLVAMAFILSIDYDMYGRLANLLYMANIAMLVIVLFMEAGRGNMTAFFTWGSNADRTIQPSEFGKAVMIIAMAKAFSVRTTRIQTIFDALPLFLYVLIPTVLVFLQPDFGTAVVYLVIFSVLIFVSGTNWKLILGVVVVGVVGVSLLFFVTYSSGSDSYRLTRIMIWLQPENYPDEAWQVLNAQKAVGVGGALGRGVASAGSLASLGYISDDHTDFVFAVCCEAFGYAGAAIVVVLYMLLLGRLLYWAFKIDDSFGSYIILGTSSMFLFHIVENIGMVIGLLPVTGIPLPFMSYGGSNMITSMMCIGLALNVIMRWRYRQHRQMLHQELKI